MMVLYDVGLAGGKSAYQYALEGGYKGTEAEFMESLGNIGEIGIILTATLTSGETSLTFTDDRITANSVLNSVYTTKYGVAVESVVFNNGTLTLEFPSQEEDIDVKVVINANLALGNGGSAGSGSGSISFDVATEEELDAIIDSLD